MAAHPQIAQAPFRSLAESDPGDLLEVVYILFGSLRQRYEHAGIRAGTRLRFRERDRDGVLVELACGELARVDAVHASFVEVRPLPAGTPWSPGAPAPRPLAVCRLPDHLASPEAPAPNPRTA